MSNKLEDIELRNEEVQEILTRVPNWMIRWGSTLFLFLIILVIVLSWLIKYPDVIQTEAILTTYQPPQKEYAKSSGRLDSVYVYDSESVRKNSLLAVLENSADVNDVYYLKSILDTLKFNKRDIHFPIHEMPILLLGEIETAYANFENVYNEYELNKFLLPYQDQAIANKTSLRELKVRMNSLQSQFDLNQAQLELKMNDLKRNKALLDKGVISQLDFENKQLEVFSVQRELKSIGAMMSQTREAIANAQKNSRESEFTKTSEEAKLLRNTLQAYTLLKKEIRDWENTFVLKSEIDGNVSFLNYWNKNQTVTQGDLVFTIIPNDQLRYIVKIKAPSLNSGKIKIGQDVNINLQNFPETEFGMLRGKVESISLASDEEGFYLIDVSLPNKLVTSYNQEIEFKQEMRGTAEIITADLRLLERFFYQFKALFDR
ncbi:HlyD family efflux transporter periplasmic adaptor subunit [Flavobacteriaceae bacterium KMM 6898]|nr:HlyD family efflux transporter periplasmic adaptor subunit [Flavobacteriaceae bacterium KMM 6898]